MIYQMLRLGLAVIVYQLTCSIVMAETNHGRTSVILNTLQITTNIINDLLVAQAPSGCDSIPVDL